MLTPNHLEHICLMHQFGQCRYLDTDDFDMTKGYCLKLRKDKKKEIDEFFKKNNKNDPLAPTGDHCKGYPYLKEVLQGYDVKD